MKAYLVSQLKETVKVLDEEIQETSGGEQLDLIAMKLQYLQELRMVEMEMK